MEKNRLEAFSDGVLAIIITIMILELSQPAGGKPEDLFALRPVLLSYLLSFVFLAIYWVNHHLIFNLIDRVNVRILWCNIAWLFVLSFIPFATAWVGSYSREWAPLSFYFGDMLAAAILFHLMYYFIAQATGKKFKMGIRNIVSLVVYLLTTLLGGFSPIAAYIAAAAVCCWWIVPERHKDI
ncbi:MAG: DUF1211 domain-containing protein [Abditibacteriota bacterium]|nr:DUF1211 domain-containing protein [Abditibacteriota bacterium]